jgi:hypothetical protein
MRFTSALGAEYHQRWFADFERVEARRDAAAAKFAEAYPRLLAELVALFREGDDIDVDCARVNGGAPVNEPRRLLSVELTARGLTDFTTKPSITATVRLPDWDSGQIIWPVQRPNDLALSVAASMMPPHDIRFTSRWWEASERDRIERAEIVERRIAEQEAEQAAARQRYEATLLEQEKERERRAHERQRG